MPRTFENPSNGYRETISRTTYLWAFIFQWMYFAYRGLWAAVFLNLGLTAILMMLLLAAIADSNSMAVFSFLLILVWAVFAFRAPNMIAKRYLRRGWVEIRDTAEGVAEPFSEPTRARRPRVTRAYRFMFIGFLLLGVLIFGLADKFVGGIDEKQVEVPISQVKDALLYTCRRRPAAAS
jgi:hypothetical protein